MSIGQLTKVRTQRRLKNCADELWKLARDNTALRLLTKESETNLMYISTSLHTLQATQCVKRRLHKRSLISQYGPVQLQAHGLHVVRVRLSVFSVLRKHSEKIFKFDICWKACKVTIVSLNCLRWIKRICTRTMNNTFSGHHFALFIYFTIKLEGMALP